MTCALRRRAGAAAAVVLLAACDRNPAAPVPLPAGAAEIAPPVPYARWWRMVEACAGLAGDFAAVRWYAVPAAFRVAGDTAARDGSYYVAGNRVVLAESVVEDGGTVRHEMLHALLRRGGHPRDYFVDRCGGVVAFGRAGYPEPASLLPQPGPGAPVLDPGALALAVHVAPLAVAAGLPDSGWVSVTVAATNPLAHPAWVRVPRYHATQGAGQTLGYVLEAAPPPGRPPAPPYAGAYDYAYDSLVAFAPHETRRRVFDYRLGVAPPTGWQVRGFFNADTAAPISLTVVP